MTSPTTLQVILILIISFGGLFHILSAFTLTILHTNDVHSRFLQTNKVSGGCSDEEKKEKQCYGGFSRLFYKVKEIRHSHEHVAYVSGGDYFQGTVWYTLYKWEIVARFVNQFQHTAMALGNHEFDDGVEGLLPFLKNVTFPIISANMDISNEPRLSGKFKKSHIVEYDGRKVGYIGYTTTETLDISRPETIGFDDVILSVEKEAQRLHSQGVKILIAVGHAGYDVDMKVAAIAHIDVVVGGHTNTFLYSGKPPDLEVPLGEYPTVITTNGRRVPVVQAYAFGKYLGYLNVTFDDTGEVTGWSGNPILMDGSVPQDEQMELQLQQAGKDVIQKSKQVVGKTLVFLDGNGGTCRLKECNLGNVIGDAMIHMNLRFADDEYWSDVSIAIMNGGSIRSSIDEKARGGSITLEDILTVFPFQNTIDLIEIKGKHLREAFEYSVTDYDPKGFRLAGKFLQVSGIRVVFDLSKPDGSRVHQLEALCRQCRVPKYEPLEDEVIYKVALPTYTATGGDGFKVIQDNTINYHLSGTLDSDMMLEYLSQNSPIIQGLDGRIKFLNPDEEKECSGSSLMNLQSFSMLTLISVMNLVIYLK